MIEHKGKIKGLILNVTEFDGWDGIDALFRHFAFVKGHHRYIERVAAVGNKSWQRLLLKLASLFVKAEPRYFDVEEIETALALKQVSYDACNVICDLLQVRVSMGARVFVSSGVCVRGR